MKNDNYFYINEVKDFYLDNENTIEHFDLQYMEGPQGNKGNFGYTGPRGLQGLQGKRGLRGIQGPIGEKGPTGYRGLAGEDGDKGDKGIDGQKGPKGLTGFIGPKGNFGPKGPPGPQGKSGDRGLEGRQGYSGSKGQSGPNGPNGRLTGDAIQTRVFQVYPMKGYGNFPLSVAGNVNNPLNHDLTLTFNYNMNPNKKVVCPPNSYLSGFGYGRLGDEDLQGDWCTDGDEESGTIEWVSGSDTPRCKIGAKYKKGKPNVQIGSNAHQFNYRRPGMPYWYRTNCRQLNDFK
jgi:hypothetical protein